ncbi:MAG: tetratricopeptide repeat protein [Desulfobacterales bacterium]|nr:tetratricopeptide repeat protein [Desulfobacterales bacterium]
MGLLDLFFGGTPEKYEQKADAFVVNGTYGQAKIEYEKALAGLDRRTQAKPGHRSLIKNKLHRCKESLAREHRKKGQSLVEAGCGDEARELFDLALELTADTRLAADLNNLLESIPEPSGQPETHDYFEPDPPAETAPHAYHPDSDEAYFEALCNSLEDAEQEAYHQYPDTFKTGFIALNQGDFDTAIALLTEAAQAYPFGTNYISLELATAHLNRGEYEAARELLESFLEEYPDALKAYYLMCDVLWETQAFDEARQLLDRCPATLAESLPIKMLVGETLTRSKQYAQAEALYQDLLKIHDWNPLVAQALAETYEAQGLNEPARDLYGEIIGSCTGCGSRVDPSVKQRYAETSFTAGDFSTKVLELFLDLVREDPVNRLGYYHRISHIYALQGNEHESRRFAAFAQHLAEEMK